MLTHPYFYKTLSLVWKKASSVLTSAYSSREQIVPNFANIAKILKALLGMFGSKHLSPYSASLHITTVLGKKRKMPGTLFTVERSIHAHNLKVRPMFSA